MLRCRQESIERPAGAEPPRLLTEEEYRIQGKVETCKALEKLRNYCRSPDFSAWTTVSRIQSPKRFADFMGDASHLTSSEISFHKQEYGLGGSFFEEQLSEEEEDDSFDTDHRSYSLSYNLLDAD